MQKIHFLEKYNYKLTCVNQLALLKANYENGTSHMTHNGFVWTCPISPTKRSNTYILKIVYKNGESPKSYIISPKPLPLAKGTKTLPHVYNTKSQRLCLYTPNCNEWNSSMPISTTIVHWAIQWMFYYEIWFYTGKWEGGGHGNWDADYKDK